MGSISPSLPTRLMSASCCLRSIYHFSLHNELLGAACIQLPGSTARARPWRFTLGTGINGFHVRFPGHLMSSPSIRIFQTLRFGQTSAVQSVQSCETLLGLGFPKIWICIKSCIKSWFFPPSQEMVHYFKTQVIQNLWDRCRPAAPGTASAPQTSPRCDPHGDDHRDLEHGMEIAALHGTFMGNR